MGYAGVDLKEEVEHFLRDGEMPAGYLPDGVDRSKSQEFMNTDMLRDRVLKLGKCATTEKKITEKRSLTIVNMCSETA